MPQNSESYKEVHQASSDEVPLLVVKGGNSTNMLLTGSESSTLALTAASGHPAMLQMDSGLQPHSITAAEDLRLQSDGDIQLAPAAGRDVAIELSHGAKFTLSSLSVRGSQIISDDPDETFRITSRGDLLLNVPHGQSIDVAAAEIGLTGSKSITIESADISMTPGWNRPIQVQMRGGAMQLPGVQIEGPATQTTDSLKGYTLTADRTLRLASQADTLIQSEDSIELRSAVVTIAGDEIEFQPGLNKDVELDMRGGSLRVGTKMELGGHSVLGSDEFKGVAVRGQAGVHLLAGDTSAPMPLVLQGSQIKMEASESVNIETAGGISMT